MASSMTSKRNPPVKKKVTFVHNQYNSPIGLYSTEQIAETINRHAQVLANNGTTPSAARLDLKLAQAPHLRRSEVYKMLSEEEDQQPHQRQWQSQVKQQHFVRQHSGELVKVAWPPAQQQVQSASIESSRRYEYSSETYETKSQSIETDQHRYLLEQKMQQTRELELQQQHREAARAKSQQKDLPPVPPPRSHQPEVVRAEPAVVCEEIEREIINANYIVQEPSTASESPVNQEPIGFKASANALEASLRAGNRVRRSSESDRNAYQNQQSSERRQPPNNLNLKSYHGMAQRRVPEPFASNELIGDRPIVAKPAPPPGFVLAARPMRRESPFTQPGAPVVRTEPFFKRGTTPVRMLGDMVWPPKSATMSERPKSVPPKSPATTRRQQKDYKPFFTQHQLPPAFPTYRAPPGTQHFGLVEGENPTPM